MIFDLIHKRQTSRPRQEQCLFSDFSRVCLMEEKISQDAKISTAIFVAIVVDLERIMSIRLFNR